MRKLSAFASSSSSSWPTKAFETLMTTTLPFVGLIKKMVEIGDVFEEDFNPHDYGLKSAFARVDAKEGEQRDKRSDGCFLEEDACAVRSMKKC